MPPGDMKCRKYTSTQEANMTEESTTARCYSCGKPLPLKGGWPEGWRDEAGRHFCNEICADDQKGKDFLELHGRHATESDHRQMAAENSSGQQQMNAGTSSGQQQGDSSKRAQEDDDPFLL